MANHESVPSRRSAIFYGFGAAGVLALGLAGCTTPVSNGNSTGSASAPSTRPGLPNPSASSIPPASASPAPSAQDWESRIKALEAKYGAKIGVVAFAGEQQTQPAPMPTASLGSSAQPGSSTQSGSSTSAASPNSAGTASASANSGSSASPAEPRTGETLEHRASEKFPMCSTFKVIAVATLLDKHSKDDQFWQQNITIDQAKVVPDSPITSTKAGSTMTLSAIADAALRYSDNTAGNLLLEQLGGPSNVTDFAAAKGFKNTRLDRTETELNEAKPGDERDTSTPSDLAGIYNSLLVGDGLDAIGQTMLKGWMLRNTTSAKRMGAAIPPGAELADKTGAGKYGVVNDVGVIYQRGKEPITVAIQTRMENQDDEGKSELIADVTREVLKELS